MRKFTRLILLLILAAIKTSAQQHFNPIVPDNIADPSISVFKHTFYLYGTTDIDHGLSMAGPPVVWKSTDFVNWSFAGTLMNGIDWDKPYNYTDSKGAQKTGYFRYWAPGKVLYRDSKYYLLVTIVKPDESLGTYVLTAAKPEGPFNFTNGKGLYFNQPDSLQYEAKPIAPDIDGDPFVDDDGSAYLFWRRRKAAKLSADWLSLEGPTVDISTTHGGYSEGPLVFKRKGIYYYLYTLSGSANYCYGYMMSKTGALGPYEAPASGPDIFLSSDIDAGVWGPGHGNILNLPDTDDYIFSYLEFVEGSTTRQVFANRMHFNADGTIQPIKVDLNGVGYLGTNSQKRVNLAATAKATASSTRADKTVSAQIETNPAAVKNINGSRPTGATVKPATRTFTYQPQNVTDSNYGTRWMAEANDKEPWLMLDLGNVKNVKACQLYFALPALKPTCSLAYSVDGQTWQTAKQQENADIQSPQVVEGIGKARYLKVKILSGVAAIWEIRVY
jgi:beta-xylosidase